MSGPVLIERDGAVAIVRMNAPERLNAFDLPMRQGMARAFKQLANDSEVRAVVVSGGDRVFAAGADLRLLADKSSSEVAALGFPDYWRPIAEFPKPVVAAVSGYALGAGCELALMCDIIVADPSARFGQPESRVGIMPGAGGTQRLVRVLGKYMASHLLFGGGTIDGARAHALGLVVELAEPGGAENAAREIALSISRQPSLALAAIKRTLSLGSDLPLESANALEHKEFLLLFDSEDQKEGMTAFLEKRKPLFKGR